MSTASRILWVAKTMDGLSENGTCSGNPCFIKFKSGAPFPIASGSASRAMSFLIRADLPGAKSLSLTREAAKWSLAKLADICPVKKTVTKKIDVVLRKTFFIFLPPYVFMFFSAYYIQHPQTQNTSFFTVIVV